MEALIAFLLAFGFSFIGSIPPATINLSIIQLGLEHKLKIAVKLALAAALVEYPYAWLAVKFESLITSAPVVVDNFQLITAVVMITLGTLNLLSANKPSRLSQKLNNSGFRRGLVLGILNPLAMPFWIGVTAYLESQDWLDVSTNIRLHSYLLGVTLGAFAFLLLAAYLAKRIATQFQQSSWLKNLPGFFMLILGIYALVKYVS
jgi:threonine/homoserine/homoserine lactone efflux protein